ncbi:ferredoxin reductase-like protein [Gloeophyllum trabeum ATCC 11539]|uniref:NADH-cytochrome b5 reductase n=1 Tax=Gloeophyllum trabeum (strain ATCC 11539 / FP-39264 / Madison 617) TaxID=670483 RepID=S7RYJ2_GLOTA|nr:ferredoxin reductase-like protein [Gloeophyllum trabeum ATCC 11539]EPQ59980.1 ferredoxin reductase-like protein [Gloeophyllum trabeum ATCC 11539]
MLFSRAAVRARPIAVNARRWASTEAKKPSSNWSLYLAGAGVAGLGAYVYLDRTGKAQAKPKALGPSPLDPSKFVEFPLKKVEPYNHNTAKYTFELPENTAAQLPVASCVYLKAFGDNAPKDAKGNPVARPYTPISPPDLPGEFVFLIKKYDTGVMTPWIANMKPGDKISVKGPLPKWPYKINEFDDVGMIAGGSGITPMYQILKYALEDPSNKTRFKLIFANVTEKDILLKEEFDEMKKKYPQTFDVIYTVDQPSPEWKGPVGYVNADLVKKTFAPSNVGDKVKIFVCGPPGQVNSLAGPKASIKDQGELKGVLKELGYNENQVFKF